MWGFVSREVGRPRGTLARPQSVEKPPSAARLSDRLPLSEIEAGTQDALGQT